MEPQNLQLSGDSMAAQLYLLLELKSILARNCWLKYKLRCTMYNQFFIMIIIPGNQVFCEKKWDKNYQDIDILWAN